MQHTCLTTPLEDLRQSLKPLDPCILVIFGATGDLTHRKLLPALYNLSQDKQLPNNFACIAFARRPKTHQIFREEMLASVKEFSRSKPIDPSIWDEFAQKTFYHQATFDDLAGYQTLNTLMQGIDQTHKTKGNRIYYLSTQSTHFSIITEKLSQCKLLYTHKENSIWSRVIIEKPFGRDHSSSLNLQKHLEDNLSEDQIYRIDHYLGKETVQNILTFRFTNPIFESLWNNKYIDHVQISVAESIGIGKRGAFFEQEGTLRDMLQNHMMQLLTLVAMEPPVSLHADAIRDEKVKVLECIRTIPKDEIDAHVMRGQYTKGFINGKPVKGYTQEDRVEANSQRETFVAIKLFVDNWRWSEVPFFLRSGKRLPKRVTEIAITFKETPNVLFKKQTEVIDNNTLVIRVQPDEGIALRMNCKVPGQNNLIQPVRMDFKYQEYFGLTPPEAYERLICDCIAGDKTLFARSDEVNHSWKFFTPILQHWEKTPCTIEKSHYAAGSWGPKTSDDLLSQTGHHWRLI